MHSLIIGGMLGISAEVKHAVLAETSFMQRVDMIGSLMCCARDQRLVDHWHDISAIAEALRGIRNDFVHGQWETQFTPPLILRVKARRQVTIKQEGVQLEQLTTLQR